jgi:Domain of unknown function (DUF4402)
MAAIRFLYIAVIGAITFSAPAAVTAQECRLCAPSAGADGADRSAQPQKTLQVDIINGLTFNRAAHTGAGKGKISVAADGTSNVGGGLVALGGYAVAGTAVIRGEPGRYVRIDLPSRVEMTSTTGGKIEIANLRTSLDVTPQLDASGQLTFSFGGDLQVDGDMAGKFRGRIPITAQYE